MPSPDFSTTTPKNLVSARPILGHSPQEQVALGSEAYHAAQNALQAESLLVHYDPIVLSCDTSPYGIGAVLSHVLDNRVVHPIVFIS